MAITITQQPQRYMPAFSPQWWGATSTQTAQPNFTYTALIIDTLTTLAQVYQIPAGPGGEMVWNAQSFVESFTTTDLQFYIYGWAQYKNSRRFRVNIGETYGAGTPTYHAGSDVDYYTWNGVLGFLEETSYSYSNFVYNSAGNLNYFCGPTQDVTFTDRSSYLFILNDIVGAGPIPSIFIKTYNAAGALIGTSNIANPFFALATINDSYICIDVGHKGLTNISGGLVTGTYPIMTAAVDRYEVIDFTGTTLIKTFSVRCEPTYTVNTVHYLAKNGGYATVNFSKVVEKSVDKTETTYSQNPNRLVSGVYGHTYEVSVDKVLSTIDQTRLTMSTDWITDEMVVKFKECFSSPSCYLDLGAANKYASIRPIANTYKDIENYTGKLHQLTMDFLYTHQNTRQHV